MQSHTVPRKLLEQFAYDDLVERSLRLWRYQKGREPYRAAPKTATRWESHFADPADAAKEQEIETRLQREFEHPVNEFIDDLRYRAFHLTLRHTYLLARYMTTLFSRSRARRAASGGQQDNMVDALRALRGDDKRITQLVTKYTMELLRNGSRSSVTRAQITEVIDRAIAEQTKNEMVQRSYIHTMETMMAFKDERLRDGEWHVLRAEPDKPFVIGDAPVVTWERTEQNELNYGEGFGRPNVEVFLPVHPTACLRVLPAVPRNRPVRLPSIDEVNGAQAAFATEHCFTNVRSTDIDAALQPYFGTVQLGINGFRLDRDFAQQLFDILMHQPPYNGRTG